MQEPPPVSRNYRGSRRRRNLNNDVEMNEFRIPVPSMHLEDYEPGLYEKYTFNSRSTPRRISRLKRNKAWQNYREERAYAKRMKHYLGPVMRKINYRNANALPNANLTSRALFNKGSTRKRPRNNGNGAIQNGAVTALDFDAA